MILGLGRIMGIRMVTGRGIVDLPVIRAVGGAGEESLG